MRQIIRRPEVTKATGMSPSTIDRLEKKGEFVQRVRLSSNSIGWFADEVEKWMESRERGLAKAPEEANVARRKVAT